MPRARIARRFVLIPLACLALAAAKAHADIPDLTWGPVEVVDDSVVAVSGASGISIVRWNGAWSIVYEKSGVIMVAMRDDSGWLPPAPLSSGDFIARDPHATMGAGRLHVVWEEQHSGHREVWT